METLEVINKFWKFNNSEPLGHSTVAVYLLLINVWDNENKSDFSISDKQVSNILKLSRKTIKNAKDTLRNLGLLSYKHREGYSCIYKIITDYEFVSETQTTHQTPKQKQKTKTEQQSVPQTETPKTTIPTSLPKDVPTKEEFLNYAKTLEIYDENIPNLDFKIMTKYESWIDNGWKNNYDKPIRNWKTALKSTLPYLLGSNNTAPQIKVPTIRRPKQTYNE